MMAKIMPVEILNVRRCQPLLPILWFVRNSFPGFATAKDIGIVEPPRQTPQNLQEAGVHRNMTTLSRLGIADRQDLLAKIDISPFQLPFFLSSLLQNQESEGTSESDSLQTVG